jgi:hypothetical protein
MRNDLIWMDPRDLIELEGRHNVSFGMHIRWKTINDTQVEATLGCIQGDDGRITRQGSSYLPQTRLILGCTLA